MKNLSSILGMWIISSLAGIAPALADGGYFAGGDNVQVETTDQRVIFTYGDNETWMTLQTGKSGDATDFAWVVPTTQLLTAEDLSVKSASVFYDLDRITAPTLVYFQSGCTTAGCAADIGDGTGSENTIEIFEEFKVGDFAVQVLGATDSQNLATWLDDEGYGVPPGGADVFDNYVAQGFYFVAVKFEGAETLHQDIPADSSANEYYEEENTFGDALVFHMPGHVTTFQLVISTLSTVDTVNITIYTIGEHRYGVKNFPTVDLEIQEAFEDGDFSEWYEEKFDSVSTDAQAFVVEFADEVYSSELRGIPGTEQWNDEYTNYKDLFVTRLRTKMPPEQMTKDVELEQVATMEEAEHLRVRVLFGATRSQGAMLPWDLMIIGALAFGIHLRRGSRKGSAK